MGIELCQTFDKDLSGDYCKYINKLAQVSKRIYLYISLRVYLNMIIENTSYK